MSKLNRKLTDLIIEAKRFGLPERDCDHAMDFIRHNEQKLALDVTVDQLGEFDIKINGEFFDKVIRIAQMMNLPEDEYLYLKNSIA